MIVPGERMKGPDGHGGEDGQRHKEIKMSGTYSAAELQTYSLDKLHSLYRAQQFKLIASLPGSLEHGEALANLKNITRAINLRLAPQFRPRTGPKF